MISGCLLFTEKEDLRDDSYGREFLFFNNNKNILKFIMVVDAQLFEKPLKCKL